MTKAFQIASYKYLNKVLLVSNLKIFPFAWNFVFDKLEVAGLKYGNYFCTFKA